MSEESQTPAPEETTPETINPQTPPPVQAADAAQAAAPAQPAAPASGPPYAKEQTDKKLIAGILAILLGGLGVHKFYLGYTVEGVIMLVVSIVGTVALCGVPVAFFVVGIVGLIEGILYLTKTDEEFVSTYVIGRKGWF